LNKEEKYTKVPSEAISEEINIEDIISGID
jgi:hypothetical protein